MVNLDKLIEHKEIGHSFSSSESVDQEPQTDCKDVISNENSNNLNEQPKMDHDSNDKINDHILYDKEDTEYQQVQPEQQETNEEKEVINNLNSSNNSDLVIDETVLSQTNKELLNSVKKEEHFFYFLDLNLQTKTELGYLFDQFRNLYIEQKLFDCTLVCEDKFIKAHKLMLAAVSSYFCSIFNSFKSNSCTNTAIIVPNVPARDMKLIIKMIYSINNLNPVKLNLNRAISLRKSVYILKIHYLNDRLDQCGFPQLNDELISNLNNENDLSNKSIDSKKRKRQSTDQTSSESDDENSSECSSSMKHHKYKHRYLLSNEHLEQTNSNRFVKCYNDILSEQNVMNDKMLNKEDDHYDDQIEEDVEGEEIENIEDIENNNLNSIKSDSINEQTENKTNDSQIRSSILTDNDNLNNISQLAKSQNQSNELDEKVIDFSLTKNLNNQEEMLKLMNSAMNDVDNTDKVANLYKAMKSEIKKLWSNNDLNSNDNLAQLNNQLLINSNKQANHLANDFFSQLCMTGAVNNLNSDTARALLFTNELLKNNQLHHPVNKNSTDNSLNTSTSSTNSSGYTQQQTNSATAALVAAQQQVLNASFLNNKNSNSNSVKQQNNLNGALIMNSSKSNSYNLQNGSSSPSNGAPVKRGRGRPPRHTQPTNGSDSGSINGDQLLSKQSSTTSQSIKQYSSSSLSNISNLGSLSNSTANSIADTLNAFNQQQKKWRPNLENLLALKIHKNKLNSSSPTNDLNSNSNSLHNSQSNLLTNAGNLSKSSSSTNLTSHLSQNGSSLKSSSNSANLSSTNNGSSTINNSSNQNVTNDGKNMCR